MSATGDPRARHERMQRLFLEARGLEKLARAALLDEACAEDPALRAELEQLLAHDRPATDGGEEPDSPLRSELDALRQQAEKLSGPVMPECIGEYRLLRKLGEGGMGTVYEARQEKLQRTVALKVMRLGSFSAQSLRRFEKEGEFLGRLEHPGIARIYDSGRADTPYGPQPYFAMELVDGVPLTEYARSRELSLHERLELIVRVADAIQYAHRQGVIHRDLKPDNILVGGDGQPKILDFGIARASDSDVRLTTQNTDIGQILGTLAYMSPEQATGDPSEIDARSDVYALGVLLHELITDRLPYEISFRTLPEALRIIQESEPPRLSTLDTALRGDIETIVQTVLEKDKTRRYPSAGSLADDLRHFLRDEPIKARPASRIYTLQKFVRRNQTLFVATLLVFFSLTAGLVASLRFAFGEAARTREVRELSALPKVRELFSRADSAAFWPLHPDRIDEYEQWIREAEVQLAKRSEFEAKHERVRGRALLPTAEDLARDRREHPMFVEFMQMEFRIESIRVMLYRRRDGVVAALPVLDAMRKDDVSWLLGQAFSYLNPDVGAKGKDALALLFALRARELATAEQMADAHILVALGYFFMGRDAEAAQASEAAQAALMDAPPERRAAVTFLREDLIDKLAVTRDGPWLEKKGEELTSLEAQYQELQTMIGERRSWRYSDVGDKWWDEQLSLLIQNLDLLEEEWLAKDGVSELVGWSVPKRLAFAKVMRDGFATSGEYARSWEVLLPEIRNDYPGLELNPQMGLIPIGRDKESGLWEFAHLASGIPPERVDGQLVLNDETGIVLVLLTGGTFMMGAQSTDPDAPNFVDIPATEDTFAVKAIDNTESPTPLVEISPYFISKYEMTQGQWNRLTGTRPSRDGTMNFLKRSNVNGIGDPDQHPVTMVSWDACTTVCERFGLTLPTSAEWEYAARAETETAWWTGNDSRALQYAANLADQFGLKQNVLSWVPLVESWSDGNAVHARVDLYDPNPFGLHNVHGNVSEWCRDAVWGLERFSPYLVDPVSLRDSGGTVLEVQIRIHRGGNYGDIAKFARSAKQTTATRGAYKEFIGLRPARQLDGR
ncbi:MAG: formylglycine-generating enzyme required for sulfatase activity/predicted Ser/Thr protein kinase [Planctomycetota bacterium]|jgi:formylglycine-generating enzyme required for sulfatase activity/predicted Ser/Thr protein kinase